VTQQLTANGERTQADLKRWALFANTIRQDVIRMVTTAASGHPGGPLGLADIYAVLFDRYLAFYPERPDHPQRDRFILSNGHVCAVAYSVMARLGAFPLEELETFRKLGSRLHGHQSPLYYPWIENAGGSLGMGLSFGVGTALAARLDNADWRAVVAMSDGECQEGMTWEAAMSAAHYGLENLVAFVDRNDIQIDGYTHKIMDLEPLADKWRAFGWDVLETDGHDMEAIDEAFTWAFTPTGRPSMILFRTILGRGVSFMENEPGWHGKPPKADEAERALAELTNTRTALEGA